MKKVILSIVAIILVAGTVVFANTTKKADNCCAPGKACCYAGSPCCHK